MRLRRSRVVAAAAIIAAHVAVFGFLPGFQAPAPVSPEDSGFTLLLLAPPQDEPHIRYSPLRRHPGTASSSAAHRPPDTAPPMPEPPAPSTAPTAIDWSREAAQAAAAQLAADAETARRARAFDGWKSHVMPAPTVPRGPEFGWDEAHIHRFVPTPVGMVVSLNDRCVVVVSFLAIIPGCKVGPIASRGDLFDHMHDAETD